MGQYTKKPVTIEAMQFTGSNCIECLIFMGERAGAECAEVHTTDNPVIHTLEGDMTASPGDWIIRGVKGELYPCKPDIFAASYMPASREADATGKPAITRAEADDSLSAAPAPRVTVESLEAKVASAEYFRSKTLTICILTLANGFTIVGKSACASPENYNQGLGERYAYDDAFRQIWAFEGYLLREKLAAV